MRMFTFWRSLASLRVRIALNLKGLNVEPVFINLETGEQFSDSYREVNPQASLPALVVDDDRPALVQSIAILEYLDETHPTPPLLPQDPRGRCRVRALAMVAADGHALIVPRVRNKLADQFGIDEEAKRAWVRYWLGRQLGGIETQLARDSETGAYAHGDAITMADLSIYSISVGYTLHDGKEAFPTVDRIMGRCAAHPAFAAAHPLKQPDAPKRAA